MGWGEWGCSALHHLRAMLAAITGELSPSYDLNGEHGVLGDIRVKRFKPRRTSECCLRVANPEFNVGTQGAPLR